MKKFLLSVGLGAGIMWLADPQNGAQRRGRARQRFAPVIDVTQKAAEKVPDHVPHQLHELTEKWTARWSIRKHGEEMPTQDITPDPTTISEFVDLARSHGVHGAMDIEDDKVVCTSCGARSEAERMERLWLHRFEGPTNPADMSTVSALRCPACHTVGLLITGYGPNASPEESDVIVRLPQPQESGMAPFMSRA